MRIALVRHGARQPLVIPAHKKARAMPFAHARVAKNVVRGLKEA
jgi:hypothetical protein